MESAEERDEGSERKREPGRLLNQGALAGSFNCNVFAQRAGRFGLYCDHVELLGLQVAQAYVPQVAGGGGGAASAAAGTAAGLVTPTGTAVTPHHVATSSFFCCCSWQHSELQKSTHLRRGSHESAQAFPQSTHAAVAQAAQRFPALGQGLLCAGEVRSRTLCGTDTGICQVATLLLDVGAHANPAHRSHATCLPPTTVGQQLLRTPRAARVGIRVAELQLPVALQATRRAEIQTDHGCQVAVAGAGETAGHLHHTQVGHVHGTGYSVVSGACDGSAILRQISARTHGLLSITSAPAAAAAPSKRCDG